MAEEKTTEIVQGLLDRMLSGDESAREELINWSCERLRRIAHKELQRYPRLRAWEQTDDVFQNATLRLWRSLKQVTPTSPQHFFNLAGMHIRRELIDLARHHQAGEKHGIRAQLGGEADAAPQNATRDSSSDPSPLADWGDFHERISRLPDQEREMFDYLWYQKLTQTETAKLLGIDERTVRRRWQAARLHLRRSLTSELPE